MRYFLNRCVFAVLLFVPFSCHIPSQFALGGAGGRNAYNVALQVTNSEQMLLNLVRLRYYDIPYFLDVGNITTQFTYKAGFSPSFKIPGFDEEHPVSLGGDLSWQNQPTIQYSPVVGSNFATLLLQPIDLRTIQQLCYSGWGVDRVFRILIQSFDTLMNAPEASGPLSDELPYYKKFFRATELMRYFQTRGELLIGVDLSYSGKQEEAEKKMAHSLQIAFPRESDQAKELSEILPGAIEMKGRYVLNMDLGFSKKGHLGVLPRSVLSCMYYLSQAVNVPLEDEKCVAVLHGEEDEIVGWEKMLDELLSIETSNSPPSNAYVAIKYRGSWFYIDDCDLTSKKTFVLLLQLYNLQGGAPQATPPILTIPLG